MKTLDEFTKEELLCEVALLLDCFAHMEGTWYQNYWKDYGVSPDAEALFDAAWEQLQLERA